MSSNEVKVPNIGDFKEVVVSTRTCASKPGTCNAALNRSAWCRRLHDHVAAAACQFRPDMANHAEAVRHIFKLLSRIVAQVAQTGAAGRASISRRCIRLLLARQLVGQRLAH